MNSAIVLFGDPPPLSARWTLNVTFFRCFSLGFPGVPEIAQRSLFRTRRCPSTSWHRARELGILQSLLLVQLIECGHLVKALESVRGSHDLLLPKRLCVCCVFRTDSGPQLAVSLVWLAVVVF